MAEKTFSLEFFKKQGAIGGKKAAAAFTADERSARARKAALAQKLTPAERVARAKKAVAAREAKRRRNPQ
jgi:hypothetical protein